MKKLLNLLKLIIPFVSSTLYPSIKLIVKSKDENVVAKTLGILTLIVCEFIPFLQLSCKEK